MGYSIRPATLKDVEKMWRLISAYAKKSLMLNRERAYLREHLADYCVAFFDGRFAGLCGFRLWNPDWLEVISLAVKPEFQHHGIGTALIQCVIGKGESLGYKYFFTLTLVPEIFVKLGFKKTNFKKIIFKVQADCRFCPKNNAGPGKGDCNEIPLELIIP